MDEAIAMARVLTTSLLRIKITVVGLLLRGSGRHEKGKIPLNGYMRLGHGY